MRNLLIKSSFLLIIAIIAILFTTAATTAATANAQTEKDLKDFVGTWKYENPDSCEVFIIKLKIVNNPSNEKRICGNYSYSKNNSIIENNIHQFDTLNDIYSFPIFLTPWPSYPSTKLNLCFFDRTYEYGSYHETSFVELIDEKNETKLRWFMEIGGTYVYEHDEEMPPNHFSVPSDVVFTKVE